MKTILSLILIIGFVKAQAFTLVTDKEMHQSQKAPLKLTAKIAPQKDAPAIEIKNPPINVEHIFSNSGSDKVCAHPSLV